jgi:AcrR family transcriptional regulator
MSENVKQPWIAVGYDFFSKDGLNGLKVEVLAREVGKSKSSFYHHFADMDLFVDELLRLHEERAKIIAEREKQCKNIAPELLHLLLDIKQDLFFNRQLRVNRHISTLKNCLDKVNKTFEDALLPIWATALGLSDKTYLARMILDLVLENFYLQITSETLTYEWLSNYIQEIRVMVNEMKKNT